MNILIGGVMRSGKTLLAEALARRIGFSYISGDSLTLALRDCFPATGVGAPGKSFDELCEGFVPFVERLFFHFWRTGNTNYVIDSHFIRPRDVKKLGSGWSALFLGFPSADPQERLAQLRAYGKSAECYTNNMGDGELLERVNRWIDYSQTLQQECLEHKVPFLDVMGPDGKFAGVSVNMALSALGFDQRIG